MQIYKFRISNKFEKIIFALFLQEISSRWYLVNLKQQSVVSQLTKLITKKFLNLSEKIKQIVLE